jgi:hypothetical protein
MIRPAIGDILYAQDIVGEYILEVIKSTELHFEYQILTGPYAEEFGTVMKHSYNAIKYYIKYNFSR